MLYMNPFAFDRVRKKRIQNLVYHHILYRFVEKNCYTVPTGNMEMENMGHAV